MSSTEFFLSDRHLLVLFPLNARLQSPGAPRAEQLDTPPFGMTLNRGNHVNGNRTSNNQNGYIYIYMEITYFCNDY